MRSFQRNCLPNYSSSDLEKWDDDGGAPARDSIYSEYGRRVEVDGSWTIYHVFTGLPAIIGGRLMKGMSAPESMNQMVETNASNHQLRRKATISYVPPVRRWHEMLIW
jgi:hypothetical protein